MLKSNAAAVVVVVMWWSMVRETACSFITRKPPFQIFNMDGEESGGGGGGGSLSE